MKKISSPWFRFNGIDNRQIGVLMTSQPVRQTTFLQGKKTTIAGRDGYVYITDGTYSPITIKQDIVIPDKAYVSSILSWLQGNGDLTFFDDPNYCYDATVITATMLNPVAKRLEGRKMSITWTCQPFKKLITHATDSVVLSKSGTITKKGHVDSLPTVKLEGNTSSNFVNVTINGTSMQVRLESGTPLYIDCDAMIAYTMDNNDVLSFAGSQVKADNGWFNLSASADNSVSFPSSITKVTVYPEWRWF